jgi:hypothetical protein
VKGGEVEILIQAAHGVDDGTGPWEGLLVSYRHAGGTWARVKVVGVPGQTLRDLLSAALLVVAHSGARGTVPDSVTVGGVDAQLELGATA